MIKRIGIIGSADCIHFERYINSINYKIYNITIISPEPLGDYYIKNFNTFFVDSKQFKFFKTIRKLWAYFGFIRKKKFDLIHCFGALSPISWIGGLACRNFLTTSVIGVDVFLGEQIKMSWIIKSCISNLLKMSDRIFFLSSAMRKTLVNKIKIQDQHLKEDFLPLSNKWQENYFVKKEISSEDKNFPIIFSPRILRPLYRQYELIQAISVLKISYPKIKLIQSGYCSDEYYKRKCENLVKDLDLSKNIIFMNSIENEESMIKIYDQSDLVVMIPSSDGMPSSLIEAWHRKRPVIVSNIYNYDESWNGNLFIKSDITPDKLSASIIKVLNSESLKENLIKNSSNFLLNQSSKTENRFELIKIKNKYFRKIYGSFLFIFFLLEPHLIKLKRIFIK